MKAEIIRVEVGTEGTFGVLLLDGKSYCVTLELPWRGNAQNISSIPAGEYTCKRVKSALVSRITGGKWTETFLITGIIGRTNVLFHPGNYIGDTHGCILTASSYGKLRDQRAVLNSGKTFGDFLTIMRNVTEFNLNIREVDLTPQYPQPLRGV